MNKGYKGHGFPVVKISVINCINFPFEKAEVRFNNLTCEAAEHYTYIQATAPQLLELL